MADNAAAPLSLKNRALGPAALVLVGAAALFLIRLGDRGVVSEEMRWAEVAREMRASGDYLRPTINGRAYYDKPVGSYWLVVAASYLTGRVDETAARLPAAVAGWFGVLLVMLLGRRLYGDAAGVAAGAVLATSFGFVFYARRATADVETVTGVLAAVWLYARNRERPPGPWVLLLWLVMAATSLTKGLLGFVLPAAVMAAHGTWAGLADAGPGASARRRLADAVRRNRWLLNWWTVPALALGSAVYLTPFLLSVWRTGESDGLSMVWRENVRRFVTPHNHVGPVYLYFGVAFVLAAPWSAFLPAALAPPRRGDPAAGGDRLARAYFWAVFAFFTLAASRRSYYLLPVLPAASLLIGKLLSTAPEALGRAARNLRTVGWVVSGLVVVAAGAALLSPACFLPAPYDHLPNSPFRGAFALGWGLALAAAGWSAARGAASERVGVAAAIAFAGAAYVFWIALPTAEGFRPRRDFAAEVRERTDHDPEKLALFRAETVVFDLGRTAPEYLAARPLAEAIRAGRVRWVLARRRYLAGSDLPGRVVLEEPTYPWEGDSQAGDKLVLLEVERVE